MWSFRSGTLDRLIFDAVVAQNEYRLPERFGPDDMVVDVGAHIGSFAYAVALRGGKHVWSIEPDRTNCALAAEHLKPYVDLFDQPTEDVRCGWFETVAFDRAITPAELDRPQ